MKTRIAKQGDTFVVQMAGRLSIESQEPLKEDLNRILREARTDSVPKKIIFDFQGLEFVGSSGISSFVQTLKDFNSRSGTRAQFCHVRSEFRRIMKAFDEEGSFDFLEEETLSVSSSHSSRPGRKNYDN